MDAFKALLTLLLPALLIQGCGRTYQNNVHVASCENGSLFIRENVDTRTGARGGVFANYTPYFVGHLKSGTPQIEATSQSVYSTPTASDRLRNYRTPKTGDWRLFVSPSSTSPVGYESLSRCIAKNLDAIDKVMSVSRPPHDHFPSMDRVPPRIATMRYVTLESLRRTYNCESGGVVSVGESGLVGFKQGSEALIGAVFDEGKSMSFDDRTAHWPSLKMKLADPTTYFGQCKTSNGSFLFQDYDVSLESHSVFWERVRQAREHEFYPRAKSSPGTPP